MAAALPLELPQHSIGAEGRIRTDIARIILFASLLYKKPHKVKGLSKFEGIILIMGLQKTYTPSK